jgi:hypothetical protein
MARGGWVHLHSRYLPPLLSADPFKATNVLLSSDWLGCGPGCVHQNLYERVGLLYGWHMLVAAAAPYCRLLVDLPSKRSTIKNLVTVVPM